MSSALEKYSRHPDALSTHITVQFSETKSHYLTYVVIKLSSPFNLEHELVISLMILSTVSDTYFVSNIFYRVVSYSSDIRHAKSILRVSNPSNEFVLLRHGRLQTKGLMMTNFRIYSSRKSTRLKILNVYTRPMSISIFYPFWKTTAEYVWLTRTFCNLIRTQRYSDTLITFVLVYRRTERIM